MATPAELLAQAQQRSVQLYLHRQSVQQRIVQAQAEAQEVDMELVRLDGEIRVLTTLTATKEPA